uniref:(northern house mosquito) hypothetical protein n=1 Tax=Culex pipiens TaxID=7175 RepID=A0A8D8BT30_CULPI
MNSFRTWCRHHSVNANHRGPSKRTWTVPRNRASGHGKPDAGPRFDPESCPSRRNVTPPRTSSSSGPTAFRRRRRPGRVHRHHSTGQLRPRQATHITLITMYSSLAAAATTTVITTSNITTMIIIGTGAWDRKRVRSDHRGIPARCRYFPRRHSVRLPLGWTRTGPVRGRTRMVAMREGRVRLEEERNRRRPRVRTRPLRGTGRFTRRPS